ncbi:MAG: hypothetical protein U0W24_23620 [Bacteroidales bacterium]
MNLGAQYQADKAVLEFIEKVDSFYSDDFLLRNGRYFIDEFPRALGNPFYLTNQWTKGDFILDNKVYRNFPLMYDIYRDNLVCIIKGVENEEIPIILNNDVVTSFSISGHYFIHAGQKKNLLSGGFYEEIYSGEAVKMYAKWSKKFMKVYTLEYSGEFNSQKRTLFLVKNNSVFIIKDNKSLIEKFPEIKKQLKTYLKQNRIKLGKSSIPELSGLTEFCNNSLSNNTSAPLK